MKMSLACQDLGKSTSDGWKSKTKCGTGHGKFRKVRGDHCCTGRRRREFRAEIEGSGEIQIMQNLVHHSVEFVLYSRSNRKSRKHFGQLETALIYILKNHSGYQLDWCFLNF